MIKRISIIFLMLIAIFFICVTVTTLYHYYFSKDSTKLMIQKASILEISDPSPKEIKKGEIAAYTIRLNKDCNYKKGSIIVTGPADITQVSKNGTSYTVNVTAKSRSGNIILNIPNGAFYCSKKDVTSEMTKTGLTVNNIQELKELVENYFNKDTSKIGLYYYDLTTKQSFGINEEKEYFPASESKLYTVLTLYDLASQNEIDINKEIYYSANDYEAGSHVMQGKNLSKPHALSELAKYAIIYSDNIAFHMLNRYIGLNRIIKNYESIIGHNITKSSNGTPNMSAKDAYLIMQKIYYNNDNNIYYNDFIDSMKNTTATTSKIVKYLPHPVARKGGDYIDHHHDVAIIYDEYPYILTVFSKGLDNANEKISEISKLIHDNR